MNRIIERHCVVCVDDEPAILAALRRSFRRDTFDVLTTRSADHALHWIETRDVSLVITDQRMPGMLGTELIEEVSRLSPSTARIILTAFPADTAATPGLGRRLECMVSKPWDAGMLRRTIRQLLLEREMDARQEEEALNEGRPRIVD